MGAVIVVLAGILLFLAFRLFRLRREICRLANDLHRRNLEGEQGKLRVTMLNTGLERLCEEVNISLEISDRSRIEANRHEAELRSQIANISHDLRTPLTAILGYIDMSAMNPEKAPAYLEIIQGRAMTLKTLVAQFYELSVMEDSELSLELEQVDVTQLLTECLLGNYSLFEEQGIQPQAELPGCPVMAMGSREAMERIFQNLLQNALKYARREISITLTETGTSIVFTIANDASQLTEADTEHLFERFYTANPARSAGSTGLGLYIVKRLLEKMQGGIQGISLENGKFKLEIYFSKEWRTSSLIVNDT